MKCLAFLSALALLPGTLSATIYMAGDSTITKNGGGGGTDGWGQYISSYVSATVSNKAVAGRSARSYTREGRFQAIADVLNPGDYVVIEFGHNDGGSLSPTDNGRTDCPGTGDETCTTTYNGVQETVLTFPKYLENAAKLFVSKGAKVLISSQTPNNPWETGTFSYSASRFVGDVTPSWLRRQLAWIMWTMAPMWPTGLNLWARRPSTHISQMTTPIPALSELKLLQTLSSRL